VVVINILLFKCHKPWENHILFFGNNTPRTNIEFIPKGDGKNESSAMQSPHNWEPHSTPIKITM